MPISMTEKAASRAKNYLESRGKGMGLKLAVMALKFWLTQKVLSISTALN